MKRRILKALLGSRYAETAPVPAQPAPKQPTKSRSEAVDQRNDPNPKTARALEVSGTGADSGAHSKEAVGEFSHTPRKSCMPQEKLGEFIRALKLLNAVILSSDEVLERAKRALHATGETVCRSSRILEDLGRSLEELDEAKDQVHQAMVKSGEALDELHRIVNGGLYASDKTNRMRVSLMEVLQETERTAEDWEAIRKAMKETLSEWRKAVESGTWGSRAAPPDSRGNASNVLGTVRRMERLESENSDSQPVRTVMDEHELAMYEGVARDPMTVPELVELAWIVQTRVFESFVASLKNMEMDCHKIEQILDASCDVFDDSHDSVCARKFLTDELCKLEKRTERPDGNPRV